jgi:hypothetical protein
VGSGSCVAWSVDHRSSADSRRRKFKHALTARDGRELSLEVMHARSGKTDPIVDRSHAMRFDGDTKPDQCTHDRTQGVSTDLERASG